MLSQPLLRPLHLPDFELPNRVVMAPVTRARADDGMPTELHAAYYAQRAGAGLIVSEGTWVSERAIGFTRVPGLYAGEQVGAWRRVTDVVHALGGRIFAQLWHTGAVSHPDHLGGRRPAGPSAIAPGERTYTASGFRDVPVPRAMTLAEIEDTIADFGAASANARRAGFDGVEIGANGVFLIAQFLNPRLNHRDDEYGERPRFLLDVVRAAAAAWDAPRVGVRLSPY